MYSVNFTDHRKKCCLSLHYNGANSYLFVNGIEIIKFKVKDSETAKICVPDVVKDLDVKVFNLISRANEIKNIK